MIGGAETSESSNQDFEEFDKNRCTIRIKFTLART